MKATLFHLHLSLLLGIILGGCLSVRNDNRLYEVGQITGTGDYSTAYLSAKKTAENNAKSHHRLLWRLHEGYLGYWAQKPAASIEAFTKAAEDLEAYESRASVSARDIGSQMLALLSEPGVRPYKGTVVDGILLHTYKGLAHADNGDLPSALAELRQAAYRRKLAHDHFKRQIEEASKKKRNLPKDWRNSSEVKEAIEDAYGEKELLPHYLNFTNPLQIHVEAILASHEGSIQNREHARKLWSTLLGMHQQPLTQQYQTWAEERHRSPNVKTAVIHVIHERGQAPELFSDALTLTLPINGRVTGIHLAFADLITHPDQLPTLNILSSDNLQLSQIASLDSLMRAERKTKDARLLIEQIGAALTKAVAENQLAKKDDLLGLGLTLFNSSVNRADTRSWSTLPLSWEGALIENLGEAIDLSMGEKKLSLAPPRSDRSYLLHLKSVDRDLLSYKWIALD